MTRPLVAISVSRSPDATRLGFGEAHLHRLSADLAELFLSLGFDLAYGGDLRGGGFAETLIGLVSRQAEELPVTSPEAREPRLVSYLAWPFVETLSQEDKATLRHTCKFRPTLPGEIGWDTEGLDWQRAINRETCTVRDAWITTTCLTRMRHVMSQGDKALGIPPAALRIVLGGRLTGMQGILPGVVEEAQIAIEDDTPLIVIGGYGGAGEALGRAIFKGELADEFSVPAQRKVAPFNRLAEEHHGLEVEVPDLHETYASLRETLLGAKGAKAIAENGLSPKADKALAGIGKNALGVGDGEDILRLIQDAAEAIADRYRN